MHRASFTILGAVALIGLALPAEAFDSPEALLEAIYEPYLSEGGNEAFETYYSARLTGIWERYISDVPEGEVGAVDFDPYIEGQDYGLSDFTIGKPLIRGDRALVNVSFNNFDQVTMLTFSLVDEQDGWRVDDLASLTGEPSWMLSHLFQHGWPEE